MQPHQQRVIDERNELNEKLIALNKFICTSPIFKKLTGAEKELMREQARVMDEYSDILQERIELFH